MLYSNWKYNVIHDNSLIEKQFAIWERTWYLGNCVWVPGFVASVRYEPGVRPPTEGNRKPSSEIYPKFISAKKNKKCTLSCRSRASDSTAQVCWYCISCLAQQQERIFSINALLLTNQMWTFKLCVLFRLFYILKLLQ